MSACRLCGRESVVLDVVVPARLSHAGVDRPKRVSVDACLASLVERLNSEGRLTASCCCGHGDGPGSVVLHDGTELVLPNARAYVDV